MITRWGWFLRVLTRRLWVRATLIALLAAAAPLCARLLAPYIPADLPGKIGADAVENILDIIASSMLAVTTFSLTTMVSAYAAATTSVTPRATKLLIQDSTSQNVLAVFVGSFLFSLVAIITLAMGIYGEQGRLVLFAFTLLVVLLIVVTLVRWIDYVIRLGRVNETTRVVEDATRAAMDGWRAAPHLSCTPRDTDAPNDLGVAVAPDLVGYVRHVDVEALARWATERSARLSLSAVPGTFVDPSRPLLHTDKAIDEHDVKLLRKAFVVGNERSFDQDPRFGLSVLAEISSRALSSAINDPGTSIDVIGRATRLLLEWSQAYPPHKPLYPAITVPRLTTTSLFDAVFTPIARDGAALVEVQVRLQKAFEALAGAGDTSTREEALRHSGMALARAESAMSFEDDITRVRAAAKQTQEKGTSLA